MAAHPVTSRLVTAEVAWFLLFSLLANSSLSLLFAVLPLLASEGSRSDVLAGITTGAMMLMTVLVQLVTPRLMTRFGYSRSLELGAALIGLPALILIASPSTGAILTVSAARGVGLAISVVAGTALAGQLFPPERRGEGLGLYGTVMNVPSVTMLPLGIWLVGRIGFDAVFMMAAVLAGLAIAIGRMLPAIPPADSGSDGVLALVRQPEIRRPAVIFGLSTMAVGILLTYLTIAVPEDERHVAAVALTVQAICTTAARWASGRLGDWFGAATLLAPSMLLCAAGMAMIVDIRSSAMVLLGMALFGLGLGGAQNASLAMMFERAGGERVPQVSVVWNMAYDAGVGIGAAGFGLAAGAIGYTTGFAVVSLILAATVLPAWQDRRRPLTGLRRLVHP